jgi:AraC-like DNA-binding protein
MFQRLHFFRDRPIFDPLTQVVRLLKPRALLWKQLDTRGPWAIRYPSLEDTVFVLVTEGSARLQLPDRPTRTMMTGDFLLMTEPKEWMMGDSEQTEPIRFQPPQTNPSARSIVTDPSTTAPTFKLLGGRFSFDRTHVGLLKEILPSVVEIGCATAGAARVAALLKMLGTEAWEARPGSALVIERLLEILLIEVIRFQGEERTNAHTGLIAGLADPQIAACLHALHADSSQDWSVATLAKAAGASRSVFAQRFCEIVGMPPMQYLLRWRMALAKEMIGQGQSISEVAYACGYQSVSGFSVAFARHVGCPPSRLRATAH